MKLPTVYTLTITNWTRYNPKDHRVKNPTWFRFQNDFFNDRKIQCLNSKELHVWVILLAFASRSNAERIEFTLQMICKHSQLKMSSVSQAILKLQELQLVEKMTPVIKHVYKTRQDQTTHTPPLSPKEDGVGIGERVCGIYTQNAAGQDSPGKPSLVDRRGDTPPIPVTPPGLNSVSAAECVEVWGGSLRRYGITRDPRFDAPDIARLIQLHGVEQTKLALLGIRHEPASDDYSPAANCFIGRFAKKQNFQRFVNLGSIHLKKGGSDEEEYRQQLLDAEREFEQGVRDASRTPVGTDAGALAEDESDPGWA